MYISPLRDTVLLRSHTFLPGDPGCPIVHPAPVSKNRCWKVMAWGDGAVTGDEAAAEFVLAKPSSEDLCFDWNGMSWMLVHKSRVLAHII